MTDDEAEESDGGLRPIIGVILMVAVTIAISAVMLSFIGSSLDNGEVTNYDDSWNREDARTGPDGEIVIRFRFYPEDRNRTIPSDAIGVSGNIEPDARVVVETPPGNVSFGEAATVRVYDGCIKDWALTVNGEGVTPGGFFACDRGEKTPTA